MAMTDHSSEAPPTYLRLSPASWAEVGEAYVNGATAKELAALWKTSPSSIYRHAGLEGWTKKQRGDAVARAHVAARRAEADERRAAGTALPSRRRADGVAAASASDGGPPLSSDPADLRAAALTRLASAIHEGRDHEALRLSALAQRLEKLGLPGAATGSAMMDPGSSLPPDGGWPDDGGFFVDWRPTREAVERETESMFRDIALISLAVLVAPERVHAIFKRRVYRFRRDVLGQDEPEALAEAERITETVLRPLEKTIMDFNGPTPRPAVRKPARTWPPAKPPFPDPGVAPRRTTPPPPPLVNGRRVVT
jgi:hypothetical protein